MPYKKCSSCDGDGFHLVNGRYLGESHVGRSMYEQIKRTCSSCNGSGKVWTFVVDPPRGGRGLWGMNEDED
jgi:DnaJ-class molecular chaperone